RARREKSYRAKSCRHAGSAVEIGRSAADYLSAELAEPSKLCGPGGLAAGGTGSGQSKPGAGGKILSAAAARSARSRFGVVVLGDAGSRRPALLRPRRAGFEHVFHSGARHGGRNISLACHTSRAHVRQPLFRFVALERMRYLRRLTALRCLVVGTAAVAAAAVTIVCWLPMPSALLQSPAGTLTLLDCRGREIAELASPEARAQFPVSLGEMGPWLPTIAVALEDRRFYQHPGIDWRAVAAACARNVKSRRLLSGASTITQQLVKLATGRQQRSWSGKLYEAIVAWKMERRWSKQRILAEYLNRSSYGNRRIGPEAAARAYFGKPARDLTLSEAIFLAGLPQAPTRFNPWRHPEQANQKYSRSLNRLVALGVITRDQQSLLASPPRITHVQPVRFAPHFVDSVLIRNRSLRGSVITTLDSELQTRVERLVQAHLAALNRHDISQAAVVVVENATGAIR